MHHRLSRAKNWIPQPILPRAVPIPTVKNLPMNYAKSLYDEGPSRKRGRPHPCCPDIRGNIDVQLTAADKNGFRRPYQD